MKKRAVILVATLVAMAVSGAAEPGAVSANNAWLFSDGIGFAQINSVGYINVYIGQTTFDESIAGRSQRLAGALDRELRVVARDFRAKPIPSRDHRCRRAFVVRQRWRLCGAGRQRSLMAIRSAKRSDHCRDNEHT